MRKNNIKKKTKKIHVLLPIIFKRNDNTYFKWWKSWASGLGKNGRWYPECAFKVDKIAKVNQSQAVAICDPIKNTPKNGGSRLEKICSIGWQ